MPAAFKTAGAAQIDRHFLDVELVQHQFRRISPLHQSGLDLSEIRQTTGKISTAGSNRGFASGLQGLDHLKGDERGGLQQIRPCHRGPAELYAGIHLLGHLVQIGEQCFRKRLT